MSNETTLQLLRQRISSLVDEAHNLRMIAHDLRQDHTCPDRAKSGLYLRLDKDCNRCRGEGALAHYEHLRNTKYA